MFSGDQNVNCIEKMVCVGDNSPGAFGSLDTKKYSLANFFCLGGNPNDAWIFMDAIVAGDRCASRNYIAELHNPTTRVLVEIKNGKITSIKKTALYGIDL